MLNCVYGYFGLYTSLTKGGEKKKKQRETPSEKAYEIKRLQKNMKVAFRDISISWELSFLSYCFQKNINLVSYPVFQTENEL